MIRFVFLLFFVILFFVTPLAAQEPTTLRVMSFNIRHGEGADRRIDLDRIAAVIEKGKPDLVALQEVDRNTKRSKNTDQARYLAAKLKMNYVFDKTQSFEGGEFGNAILSRFPILRNTSLRLPKGESGERGVLVAEIKVGKKKDDVVRFACTLLSHRGGDRERLLQAKKMNTLFFIEGETSPVILAGDFFAGPKTKPIDEMRTKWSEAGAVAPEKPNPEESEKMGDSRQDYIFFRSNDPFQVKEARILKEPLLQQNPLFAVLAL